MDILKFATLFLLIAFAVGCNALNSVDPDAETTNQVDGASHIDATVAPCTQRFIEDKDPCARRRSIELPEFVRVSSDYPDHPPALSERLDWGSPIAATHVVVRGTIMPNTTRCKAWPVISPSYIVPGYLLHNDPDRRYTICHVEVSVGEYIIGDGPSKITVATTHVPFRASYYDDLPDDVPEDLFDISIKYIETVSADSYEGIEWILQLSPSVTQTVESWVAGTYWDVQQKEDDEIIVVAADIDYYEWTPENLNLLEIPLDRFRRDMLVAHNARVTRTGGRIGVGSSLPALITDANGLHSYFVNELRAYENLTATPALPPPVPGENDPFTPGTNIDDPPADDATVTVPGALDDTATDTPTVTPTSTPTPPPAPDAP